MDNIKKLKTLDEIKAFSDPYRLKIITKFKNFKRPATVKEIADALEEVPAKIHYHVKKLEKVNLLELKHKREINGIIAKYYQLTAETFVIEYTENNEELKEVVLHETQRAIVNQYEESKKIVLQQVLNKKSIDNDDVKLSPELTNHTAIYLSEDEMKELKSFLDRLGKNKKDKDHNKKVHLFTVVSPYVND